VTKEMEMAKLLYETRLAREAAGDSEKQIAVCQARAALGKDIDTGKRDLIFEAICSALGADWTDMPKHEAAKYNVAAKQLRDIGATPSEIIRRARRYETVHPEWELTATSLITHWSTLKGGGASTRVQDRVVPLPDPEPEVETVPPTPEFLAQLRKGQVIQPMPEVD